MLGHALTLITENGTNHTEQESMSLNTESTMPLSKVFNVGTQQASVRLFVGTVSHISIDKRQ